MRGERENKTVICTIQYRATWQWKKFLFRTLYWVELELPNTRNIDCMGKPSLHIAVLSSP